MRFESVIPGKSASTRPTPQSDGVIGYSELSHSCQPQLSIVSQAEDHSLSGRGCLRDPEKAGDRESLRGGDLRSKR